jgi:hypothetical protein
MISARVSPQFTGEKLQSGSIEDRLDVYEDRVFGWFLDHAQSLAEVPAQGGFDGGVLVERPLCHVPPRTPHQLKPLRDLKE